MPLGHQFRSRLAVDGVVGFAGATGQPVTESTDDQNRLDLVSVLNGLCPVPAFIFPSVEAETFKVQSNVLRVFAVSCDGVILDEAEQTAVDGALVSVVVVRDVTMLRADPIEDPVVAAAMRGEYNK